MNNPTDKFFKVFIAGKYPQGEITEQDLKEIADNYNPKFHDAPLTKDHERTGEALGRVGKLEARGKELFAQFSKISDTAKQLIRDGKYNRPSIEIAEYSGEGEFANIQGKYCRAITMTNFAQVKGLPDFAFNDEKGKPVIYFSEDISKDIPDFNKDDFKTEIIKQKKYMNPKILTFATSLEIDFVGGEITLNDFAESVIPKVEKIIAQRDDAKHKFSELERKYNEQKIELEKVQTDKVNALVNQAFSDGKILPAQKADYVDMATKDYEFTEKVIKNLPVNKALVKNMVSTANASGENTDPKYFDENGKKITYKHFLDPKTSHLVANFSEDEQLEMRNEYFKK